MTDESQSTSEREIELARGLLERACETLSNAGLSRGRLPAPLQRLRLAREQLENKLLKLQHFAELSRLAQSELAEACDQLRDEVECVRLHVRESEPPAQR